MYLSQWRVDHRYMQFRITASFGNTNLRRSENTAKVDLAKAAIRLTVQLTGIEKTGYNENPTQTTPQTAALTTSKVLVNGNAVSFDAYQSNGNNYFKLRDLGQTFDFGVGWNGANNTVTIDANSGYTTE